MKKKPIPYEPFIILKKNQQYDDMYDVELNNHEGLHRFSSIECHCVLYPYSRSITSRHITFCPFEEYVRDIQACQRSAYQKRVSQFNKFFGIFLGGLIVLLFYFMHPGGLLSLESLLSLLGAYFIGKELWDDLENVFIKMSHGWKIRYQPSYYAYTLVKNSTLAFYSQLAKVNRYGKRMLLPEKIDFIQQSNSQTLRLYFKNHCYSHKKDKGMHIFSIHLDPGIVRDFHEKGYMFGLKISFNKTFAGLTCKKEYFQSINHLKQGCLDAHGMWCEDSVFYRKTINGGRIKIFLSSGVLENKRIVERK